MWKWREKIIDYVSKCECYKKEQKKETLLAKSQGSTTKFAREQRAEKSCKQVAFCISRRMRNTSNQLFPKEIRRTDKRVSYQTGNDSEESMGKRRQYKCVESSLVAFSAWCCGRGPSYYFASSLSVASRISSRAFRPKVIYLYADAKNSSGKSDETSSFRSRVTNHLSRRARFRSTPKRGERWNCNDSKNASRCGDRGIILLRLNFCQLICCLTRKLFSRIFSLYAHAR